MEPKGSLPHSQVPATCPYPEPAQSITNPHTPRPEDPSYIIFPSTPGSSKWRLSLRFPYQNPVYASSLPHTCYMLHLFHSSRFDHPNDIGWGVHIIMLHILKLSPFSCYLVPLRPKYSPQHPILKGGNCYTKKIQHSDDWPGSTEIEH